MDTFDVMNTLREALNDRELHHNDNLDAEFITQSEYHAAIAEIERAREFLDELEGAP